MAFEQYTEDVMQAIDAAPTLESRLLSLFWRKVRAMNAIKINPALTGLPPLEARLLPGALQGRDFVGAMPVGSFVSLAKAGFISRMKSYLESGNSVVPSYSYQVVIPPSILVAYSVPAMEEPSATIIGSPQRLLRIMKDGEQEFYKLLISDEICGIMQRNQRSLYQNTRK